MSRLFGFRPGVVLALTCFFHRSRAFIALTAVASLDLMVVRAPDKIVLLPANGAIAVALFAALGVARDRGIASRGGFSFLRLDFGVRRRWRWGCFLGATASPDSTLFPRRTRLLWLLRQGEPTDEAVVGLRLYAWQTEDPRAAASSMVTKASRVSCPESSAYQAIFLSYNSSRESSFSRIHVFSAGGRSMKHPASSK